ncbi:MAG TPA: hypothetical protein VID75_01390 [Acidimicrobiales bacterium]|jgi:hypothetical protein
MFEHLDDPSPPAATPRGLRTVLARATRLRRRRATSAAAAVGIVTLALGLVIGLAVPRAQPAIPAFTAFDTHVGPVAIGTAVPLANLADVVFISDSRGFGLALHGEDTVLAATADGGKSWRVVDDEPPAALPAQLEFADADHGYLWGGAPSAQGAVPLWITSDGGRSWERAPVGPVVSDVSAIGSDVWAVVGTCALNSSSVAAACPATVEVSLDGGVTWRTTPVAPPVSEEPGLSVADQDLELARITPRRAYVLSFAPSPTAGSASLGRLGYTADGGQTWISRPDPCPTYFDFGQEIAASGTNDLWMVCGSQPSTGSQAKALFRSSDGGQHWTLTAAANAPVLSGDVSLAATGGLPTDGYVSPLSLGHENLAVLTPQDAWLFPDRSGVFQTSDGGRTWSPVSGLARAGLVGGGTGNVVFVDADHGWVCEVGAGLWRTTDGTHWQHLGS